jgi:L-ascorbate metabolism protein UlaG (beta-lactamase superfamily)
MRHTLSQTLAPKGNPLLARLGAVSSISNRKLHGEIVMRRCAIVLLLLPAFFFSVDGLGLGKEKEKEKEKVKEKEKLPGGFTIEYHAQSMYIITTTKGKRIAFDPHDIPAYKRYDEKELTADIVCISHNHNDHIQVGRFKKNKDMKILYGLKESPNTKNKTDWVGINQTIGDIKVRNVGAYHDDSEGLLRGKNSVFIVEVDGWRICHLGDLGHQLTERQLKEINKDGAIDVLMIPVGGIYTLNGDEARKVVKQIKPKEYVFPMHYGTDVFDDILTSDEFFDGLDKNHVAISDDNVVRLNRDGSRPRPLFVQLNYCPKEEKKVEKKDKKK